MSWPGQYTPEQIESMVADYRHILEAHPRKWLSGPSCGWIQWKGTSVCMDLYFTCCNVQGHADLDFLYFVRCPRCGKIYQVNSDVLLVPVSLDPDGFEAEQAARNTQKCDPGWTRIDSSDPLDAEDLPYLATGP